jgi:hypothetical protein
MAALGTLERALNDLKAVVPGNKRQCWSSETLDGSAIVGLFIRDQFVVVPTYGSHRFYLGESVEDFEKDSPGFKKWRQHLIWAWQNNRRILVIEVERGAASPTKFLANPSIVMKLTTLDEKTGAYLAREERADA